MLEPIISMCTDCIRAANTWFLTLLDATGMETFLLAFIGIALSARFILQPILGGRFFAAASDRIKKSSIGEKNEGD